MEKKRKISFKQRLKLKVYRKQLFRQLFKKILIISFLIVSYFFGEDIVNGYDGIIDLVIGYILGMIITGLISLFIIILYKVLK